MQSEIAIKKVMSHSVTTRTRFVVVGTQRSGTTLIQTALDSHPEIRCEGELFLMRRFLRKTPESNYPGRGYHWWISSSLERWVGHVFWREAVTRSYLEWFFDNHAAPVLGFKLMWKQAERFPATLKFIEENGVLLLHVRRRNVLRSLVSRFVARARDLYHSTKSIEDITTVKIPSRRLKMLLDRITEDNKNWERLGRSLPYLRVDYEDYVANPSHENRRILHFLGASTDVEIKSPLVKVTPNDLKKVIANYDEVKKELIGTEYEAMLES